MIDFESSHFPYPDELLTILYENLLRPRLIEEKMLILLRQGKLGKWFSGIGQEAISVGACLAMRSDEYILPMHRNLGVFTSRKVPLDKLIAQFKGYTEGYTKGRDRSFHFGSKEHHIVGMISHLGPQLAVADGIALGSLLNGKNEVCLVFCGEGSTSQGDFHEALNVAAVWNLPVLFVIENNGYGLSTPISEQYKCASLSDRGPGYGIEARQIDGNNILTVFDTFNMLASSIRENPRPVLIECMTFRMRGHEEASGNRYVPQEQLDLWATKDPVQSFEQYLLNKGLLNEQIIAGLKQQIHIEIETAIKIAFSGTSSTATADEELYDVYAPLATASKFLFVDSAGEEKNIKVKKIKDSKTLEIQNLDNAVKIADTRRFPAPTALAPNPLAPTALTPNPIAPTALAPNPLAPLTAAISPIGKFPEKRFIDAITESLSQSMQRYPELILMGQDIAEYGGAFKVTEGLVEQFGKSRVRNTPLCESAIVGIGLGLAIKGGKSVIEMQFSDFVTMAFNQIVNNLAKTHYRWGQSADVVIRMPCGAGTAAGPFHSQTNEAWFLKTPGLKVVYPAFAYDAKGLLAAAIQDPNPVLFFEHKFLYRSLKDNVPDHYYTLPIGVGIRLQEGKDLSIITYGLGVHWAIDSLGKHPEIKADLIDLRSLMPWDKQLVIDSVRKTGKVIILHEDTLTCGMGAEIAAYLAEHAFDSLDAPIMRCASLDSPIPASKSLEDQFLASSRFENDLLKLFKY